MQETNFDDWPLDGVRSVRTVVKDLRRANKSFMDSHFDWARSSGVRPADRAVHEHRTLSNIFGVDAELRPVEHCEFGERRGHVETTHAH